jgi:hypothetical protein
VSIGWRRKKSKRKKTMYGIHPGMLMVYISKELKKYSEDDKKWMMERRFGKPYGMVTIIIAKLKDIEDDAIVMVQIRNLSRFKTKIEQVIKTKNTNEQKRNAILDVLATPSKNTSPPIVNKCPVCKKERCTCPPGFRTKKVKGYLGH